MNQSKIDKNGHNVYNITLCLPYIKDYDDYNINNTKEWNQILAIKPNDYFAVCKFTKDTQTGQNQNMLMIIGFSVGSAVLIIVVVVISIVLIRNSKKDKKFRDEVLQSVILYSSVVSDFG